MNNFLFALQFLTAIPLPVIIKPGEGKKLSNSLIYFPLVGLCLGLILWGVNNVLSALSFQPFSITIIVVVLLIFLTGGIHVDGLADCCDGFLSGKNKEDTLKIMRDPHIGVMGVLGIISIVLLKISFFYSLGTILKGRALLLMCALSRWALVLSIFLFPYAREQGKAKIFFEDINSKVFLSASLITLIIAGAILKWAALTIIFLVVIFTLIINLLVKRRLGGLTGDSLGAVCELNEVIILFLLNLH